METLSPTENDWRLFSRAFRAYESNQFGYCTCFTCGHIDHWKKMDTGHYIDRRWDSLKFHLLNLEVQCKKCNRFLDGNLESYRRQLKTKYRGEWIISFLDDAKLFMRPLNRSEVKWLISYLRAGIKQKM